MTERANNFLRSLNPVNMNKATGNSNPNSNTQLQSIESDKVFLERTHVKSILDALLDSLCKNQPDDPISYICT